MQAARTILEWDRDKQRGEKDRAKRLKTARIPEVFHDKTWDDYEDDAVAKYKQTKLKDILMWQAEDWTPESRDGLVVLGPAGYGKTFGLCLLAMALSDKGAWVKYIPYAELVELRQLAIKLDRQGEQSGDWEEYNRVARRLLFLEVECDALFLDDVGKEYRAKSGWSDDGLDRLLRKRVELGKLTFISSNTPYEDWNTYNSSMASFLAEVGEVVELVGGRDHRRRLTDTQRRREQHLRKRRGEG